MNKPRLDISKRVILGAWFSLLGLVSPEFARLLGVDMFDESTCSMFRLTGQFLTAADGELWRSGVDASDEVLKLVKKQS